MTVITTVPTVPTTAVRAVKDRRVMEPLVTVMCPPVGLATCSLPSVIKVGVYLSFTSLEGKCTYYQDIVLNDAHVVRSHADWTLVKSRGKCFTFDRTYE